MKTKLLIISIILLSSKSLFSQQNEPIPVNGAIIQGSRVSVSGTGTSAIGLNTQASGNYSFSFGNGTKSLGLYSMAGGWNSQA